MFLFLVAFLPVVFKIGFVSLSALQHWNCPNGYRLKPENAACVGKLLNIPRLRKLHLYFLNLALKFLKSFFIDCLCVVQAELINQLLNICCISNEQNSFFFPFRNQHLCVGLTIRKQNRFLI